jgi:Uma2 family endonuclease
MPSAFGVCTPCQVSTPTTSQILQTGSRLRPRSGLISTMRFRVRRSHCTSRMELVPGSDDVRMSPGVKLTYDDFVLFPDDGNRHELIDGEHFVTPSPNQKHQQVVLNICLLIGNWLEQHPIGRLFPAPFDVIFSEFDVVEPDLLYMSNERAANVLTKANVQGAPELVIEIGSPSTRQRDETVKRRLYERAGVSEYWVVDPELDVVRVYRRGAEGFERPHELTAEAGEVLETPVLPGLTLPLARIFRL